MSITRRAASLLALAGYHLSRYKLLFIRLDELALGLLLLTPAYFLGVAELAHRFATAESAIELGLFALVAGVLERSPSEIYAL